MKKNYFLTNKFSKNTIIYTPNIDVNITENIFIILPTFNRAESCINVIKNIIDQTYTNWKLLVIDDGSTNENLIKKENFIKELNDPRILFHANNTNIKLPASLNIGIDVFLKSDSNYMTWISDDNKYETIFLENLMLNCDFSYSSFILKSDNECVINKQYNNVNDIITNFHGLSSFMWSKTAIIKIGKYNENLFLCEDYEYLLRTFMVISNIKYSNNIGMTHFINNDSLTTKHYQEIRKLTNDINLIYNKLIINYKQHALIYYSKNSYELLFQRPQQIMRHFSKNNIKIFITNDDIIKYEEKYLLLIINYKYKNVIFNILKNNTITIYFTDSRLIDEILEIKLNNFKKVNLLYDLIDPPIDEFIVWKPYLNRAVNLADFVIYSHPNLISFLKEVNNFKKYFYISNACDYDYFSKSKIKIGSRPIDFPVTNKPILGYYGAISEWLDYDIIKKYADEEKYHIIMIGCIPKNKKYNMQFAHNNITWLNHKSYNELPYYLSWFDVCFLPFKNCELTKYVNPCKLWEYMACEKQIIQNNVNIKNDEIITWKSICKSLKYIISINYINMTNHVAIITNMYLKWDTLEKSIGGGERYCDEIINILVKNNCKVSIHQLGHKSDIVELEKCTVFLYKNTFEYYEEFAVGFGEYINNILLSSNVDLVIYLMPELCCGSNILSNSILINHGIWFDRKIKTEKYFDILKNQLDKCDTIICVDTNYINFVRTYWGYNKYNNLIYIPNFVADEMFCERQINETNKLTVLFPRRANIYRGACIIPALLQKLNHDVNIIWCGGGDYENKLKELQKKDSRFTFTEAKFDEIINYYIKSDIVVIPTLASEGTSLSCIEGLATSNVVISTNVGGLPNIIINEYNGFLCDNTENSIIKTINHVIENYKNMGHVIKNGYNIAKQSFNKNKWDESITKILNKKLKFLNYDNLNYHNVNYEQLNNKISNKKIAIITKNCINGGVESIIREHVKNIKCDVFICGGKITPTNKPFVFKKNLKTLKDVYDELIHYDIIISHWIPQYAQDALVYLKDFVKIIEFVHRKDTSENNKNILSGIITHSDFLKEYISKTYNFNEDDIYVINHPINTHIYRPLKINKTKIGVVGSYNEYKGIDIFINAVNKIKQHSHIYDKYEWCVYGKDDGIKNNLIKMSHDLNLNITFYDNVDNIVDILNEFEILCIPSTLEGFPMVLCEALSCNLKIITSDIEGFKEFNEKASHHKYINLFLMHETNNFEQLQNQIINLENGKITINNNLGNEYISKYYNINNHVNQIKHVISKYNNFTIKKIQKIIYGDVDLSNDFGLYYVNTKNNELINILNNNITIKKTMFLRCICTNPQKYIGSTIKITLDILSGNNMYIGCQIDYINEINMIVYDISEIIIENNIVEISSNVINKLSYINIVPYDDTTYITIKNINIKTIKFID